MQQPCPNCRELVDQPAAHRSRTSGFTCVRRLPDPLPPGEQGKAWPPRTEQK